ncbi:MAG: EamA family transporter RarD [Anaerolineales bacterium]|nr:EamA family transporter RarD [Anaerolineales bacterium]
MNRGILYAASAYLLWGFLPVYWKALQSVPATQILSHRIVWSMVFLAALIAWKRDWARLRQAIAAPKTLLAGFLAACLLAVNWLTYIWGVNAGFVVETSLGYFINPLVNVMLGVIFLRERLRPWQWLPVGLAAAGVAYLTLTYGSLPWIALTLAFTFGLYGLIKKLASLGALTGLALETGILFGPALLYLLYLGSQGVGAFSSQGAPIDALLAATGVVTAFPLLLFGMGARRIHLSTLGILQYIAPTCQLFLGVLVYGEPFTPARLVGFGLIWAALIFYSVEGYTVQRKSKPPLPASG